MHSVQVAMRMGLCLIETRDRIELPELGSNQEWSVVVYGLDEDTAISIIKTYPETTVSRLLTMQQCNGN